MGKSVEESSVHKLAVRTSPDASELDRLRALLFGADHQTLIELKQSIEDPRKYGESVAQVISEAIRLRSQRDETLAEALRPSVERALTASVNTDPRPLADALYPVMGPAIRRSISETLSQMLETFNAVLERSLSPRSLRWRFDAWRAGKPYAEIVLLRMLVFQVEQVFLIHRETGLLLQHVVAEDAILKDPDMVSGMLTAIQDFVVDSFHVDQDEALSTLRLADLTVLVEQGPKAVIAVVIRGTPPKDLRVLLTETLEAIHRTHGQLLEAFHGDSSVFLDLEPVLRSCLKAQRQTPQRRKPWLGLLVLAGLCVGLSSWGISSYQTALRWQGAIKRLQSEPGLVVVAAHPAGQGYTVTGLRDPLARDPVAVVGQKLSNELAIDWQWQPYISTESPFLLARARRVLKPPATARLEVQGTTLRISGEAPAHWISRLEEGALPLTGIERTDMGALQVTGRHEQALMDLQQKVESIVFYYEAAATEPNDSAGELFAALVDTLDALMQIGGDAGKDIRLSVMGHTDASGSDETNMRISQARADSIRSRLLAHGFEAERITSLGVGNQFPGIDGDANQDRRRVTFQVQVIEPGNKEGARL